ncbi:MAG TPA: XdhC/CoxI family protein [bacterium]|nr:XdhC/CoxI family protein [bacterium]
MSNRQIYEELEAQLRAGKPVVQATVIQTRGSTPRKEGSTMLVRADGSLVGTIGGGCGEAGVIQKAKLSLLDGQVREELADLTEDISTETEAVCGGTLRVFIEPWEPTPQRIELAHLLEELSSGNKPVVLHQVVKQRGEDVPPGQRLILDADGKPLYSDLPEGVPLPAAPTGRPHQMKTVDGLQIYTERWDPVPTLVIIGAGHIAEPLEALGRMAGFRTVVVDDRTLFANRQRFPDADQVVCGPILDVCRQIDVSPHHYFVLVTRGHTLDMDALRVMIGRDPVAYLGMIGSKRRVGAVFELLEKEGFGRELFQHVYAPIGLNIGAETPAEIAVSVMAEIISVRRQVTDDTGSLVRITGLHPSLRRAKLQPAG